MYYSVESGLNTSNILRELETSPQKFYEFAGINLTDSETKMLQMNYRDRRALKIKPRNSQLSADDCRKSQRALPLLATKRCSECPACTREACGKCDSCARGGVHCLRKVSRCLLYYFSQLAEFIY